MNLPTSSLGLLGLGRLLVLSHLHLDVLLAPGAVGVAGLGHVNHLEALYLFPLKYLLYMINKKMITWHSDLTFYH